MAVADALLIVEGPHDAEFAGRLLKGEGYARVTVADDLPEDWKKLIPTTFPKANRALNQPHEVPQFRRRADNSSLVVTVISGGDSKLASTLIATLDGLGRVPPAIGIVLDDDTTPNPLVRHQNLLGLVATAAAGANWPLTFPAQPGTVGVGASRSGIFVLPDNQGAGTLETLLLQAGQVAYPRLLEQATAFVNNLDVTGLTPKDVEAGVKPAGPSKQIMGVATAILRPGRTVAVSLQDNRWLEGAALQAPLVAGFRGWLHDLLELPSPNA